MKKLMTTLFVALILVFATTAWAEDEPVVAKTYFTAPPSQTLPAYSTFNPAVTVHKDGKVTKTYLQHRHSELFPAGSTFNPYITVTEKKGKK